MLKRKDSAKAEPQGASKFGRYRVLSELGHGAMATVYLAEDPALNRLVAVKVIHSHLASIGNLLDRFTVEAKTAASLRCPNIVEIFDYGLQDGQQYLVMEYIDGPNLQFVLNLLNGKAVDPEACAAVIGQAAEGLAAAEKNNVVHRDIKPENMMFTSEGILKIADFGIAHINEQNLTQTGSILGSPSFMSPEQIDGGKPTHQTDMFSLGSVFYYCLTGRKPFSGNNIPTIMRNICDLPHPPVTEMRPEADPELTALVDTLLRKKPEERGKGARWLSLQIRSYLNKKGVLDLPEKARSLLQQVTSNSGDRTVVEAPRQPSSRSAPPPTPLKPGATRSFKAGPAPKAAPQSLVAKLLSPLGIAVGGVALLALVTVIIWVSLLVKKPEGAAVSQNTGQAGASGENPAVAAPPKLQGLSVDPAQIELALGESRFVRAVPVPAEVQGPWAWRSSDPSVVEVASGEVRALKPGKVQIAVTRDSTPGIQGICEVAVTAPYKAARPVAVKPNPPPTVSEETPVPAPKPAAAGTVEISVISAPPFSEVFLDNKYLGTTPLKKVSVVTGRHRLMLSHRDFHSLDTNVVIRSESTLKFRLLEQ